MATYIDNIYVDLFLRLKLLHFIAKKTREY